MRKILALTFLISAAAVHATECADTIAAIGNAQGVSVTSTDTGVILTVKDSSSNRWLEYSAQSVSPDTLDKEVSQINFSLPFMRKENTNRFEWLGIRDAFYQVIIPTSAPPYMKTSSTFGISTLLGMRWWTSHKTTIDLSLGMSSTVMYLEKGAMLASDNSGALIVDEITFEGIPEITDINSRIYMCSMLVPLTITQRLHNNFAIRFGVAANFNTFTSAKTWCKNGGVKYTTKIKGLQQRILTPEFSFGIGWVDDFGVFVKYNPCARFKTGYGPEYRELSVGFSLFF